MPKKNFATPKQQYKVNALNKWEPPVKCTKYIRYLMRTQTCSSDVQSNPNIIFTVLFKNFELVLRHVKYIKN